MDHVDEPNVPPVPPKYVAALFLYPNGTSQPTVHIGAALVTGGVVEYLPEDHAVRLTDIGYRLGMALVNPEHFTHTDIANILIKMNATDGRDPTTGNNVTRVIDNQTPVHPISYQTARQQARGKHYL